MSSEKVCKLHNAILGGNISIYLDGWKDFSSYFSPTFGGITLNFEDIITCFEDCDEFGYRFKDSS